MEGPQNGNIIVELIKDSHILEPLSITRRVKKVRKSNTNSPRVKRRIFYKISDQVFESLFQRFDYLERDKLSKEMFLIDNNEELYLKNKSILNKVNYIKCLYN